MIEYAPETRFVMHISEEEFAIYTFIIFKLNNIILLVTNWSQVSRVKLFYYFCLSKINVISMSLRDYINFLFLKSVSFQD